MSQFYLFVGGPLDKHRIELEDETPGFVHDEPRPHNRAAYVAKVSNVRPTINSSGEVIRTAYKPMTLTGGRMEFMLMVPTKWNPDMALQKILQEYTKGGPNDEGE